MSDLKEVEFEEFDVSDLCADSYECMDCGHSGKTYKQSTRVIDSHAPDRGIKVLPKNKSASEEDDIAVVCPKCLSWFYFEDTKARQVAEQATCPTNK
tara:strand:+ start:186 stop:476 length:291 start_codon:yes stop_codon:yes gene_type:complete